MEPLLKYWQRINFQFDKKLGMAIRQQHLAAQFIALIGRYMVPKEADSGNINMQFVAKKEMLLGNPLENGIRIGLNLSNLEIYLLNANQTIRNKIALNNKSFDFAFAELKLLLIDLGLDVSTLKNEQPYTLPSDVLMNNKFYTANTVLKEATILRHNAEFISSELAAKIKGTVPVRIRPHHFDTGTYFATARNEQGEVSQTIGMGWAIPDEMIKEPYYYISFWSEKELKKSTKFRALDAGRWKFPVWNGAVLEHSEIINESSAQKQHQLVKQFFNEGISVLTRQLKK